MKKFDDKDLWTLLRLTPLVFLSYFQFLSWEDGEIWALAQWFSIILATISLIIFSLIVIIILAILSFIFIIL